MMHISYLLHSQLEGRELRTALLRLAPEERRCLCGLSCLLTGLIQLRVEIRTGLQAEEGRDFIAILATGAEWMQAPHQILAC